MARQPSPTAAPIRVPLTAVFFLSGASGLLFETLWFHQAGLALGSSHWATAVVLGAFMGGLALGNLAALLRSAGTARPVRTYACLEGAIALLGPLLVLALPALGRLLVPLLGPLADHPGVVNPLRFLVAFLLLLLPASAMGYTLPVLTEALSGEVPDFRALLGRLYGWNTLGAVAGVLAGELVLIKHLGILGTALTAGAFNLVAAGTALRLTRGRPSQAPREQVALRDLFRPGLAPWWASVALAGALLLALEVVWMRFLALFVRITSLAFATMLVVVLAGIALGGLAAPRLRRLQRVTSLVPLLAGALCALGYALFPWYHRPFDHAEVVGFARIMLLALPLILPVSFCSGVFFTFAGAGFRNHYPSAQAASGALTLFNTLGAALGAMLAGLLLIPRLGMERSIFLLALLYGAVALLWWCRAREGAGVLAWGAGLWLLSLVCFPFGAMTLRHVPQAVARWAPVADTRIVSVREGADETVVHLESRLYDQRLDLRMLTNSFAMSDTNFAGRRYMKTFVYWPMAFHPDPRRALLICYGVGSTAKALTDQAGLQAIDVVDISRDVLELAGLVYPAPGSSPLEDPRVRVHVEDGRFFLQATRERWDIITGEPPPPCVPGVASLYSREYFQLVHDRLNEGGMATYWLPINQMGERATCSVLRAFSDVFQECYLWHGSRNDLVMVGIRGNAPAVSAAQFSRAWRDPVLAPELARLGFETPAQLLSGFIGDRDYIRSVCLRAPALVDDFPRRLVGEQEVESNLLYSWFTAAPCRDRFLASASLRRRLPAEVLAAAAPGFDVEALHHSLGTEGRTDDFPCFPLMVPVLQKTALQAPILWEMGSTGDIQDLVQRLAPARRLEPGPQYHAGAGCLAARDFQGAFKHLQVAAASPRYRRVAVATGLFVLCYSGQRTAAEAFLARWVDQPEVRAIPRVYWAWMARTYGLSVPPG